jgi:glycosyltransferase involved in cell wall biosynthesis
MNTRKLLVLDTAFSYEAVIERNLTESILCRDLDGFFSKVFSVHPFATLVTSDRWGRKYGSPDCYYLSERHTLIEGKFQRFPILSYFRPLNFALAQLDIYLYLLRLIREEGISFIRAGDALYLGVFGYFLSLLSGAKLVVRVGSNNEKIREVTGGCVMPRLFYSPRLERAVERFVLTRADLVVAANGDNLQFAINSGAAVEKSTIFRYGNLLDKRHFIEPSARASASDEFLHSRFILCIARLESVKRVGDVIRVLAELVKRGHDVRGLLVGDGSERVQLELLATSLSVMDRVIFCGNRDQEWLSRIIPMAALVVSPHTGRALCEVALGGAPIVAYDIDWQSEIVETGETGELVPFGDVMALVDAAERLLLDREYSRSLGLKARDRALRMMDRDRLDDHERLEYAKLFIR